MVLILLVYENNEINEIKTSTKICDSTVFINLGESYGELTKP